MRAALKVMVYPVVLLTVTIIMAVFLQNCTKEKIVVYGQFPPKVKLVSPLNNDTTDVIRPTFTWQSQSGAIGYQLQIAADAAFSGLIAIRLVVDTTYNYDTTLHYGRHFWRVRAQSSNNVWGDWSDASIWSFTINGNSAVITFRSRLLTFGIPQDVFVEGNTAYIADGEADLTVVDVSDPNHPAIIGNVDTGTDDIAKAVWKRPGDNYVYLADMIGKLQVLDVTLPLDPYAIGNANLGIDQHLEDIFGLVYGDSLFMFTVASGSARTQVMRSYHIIYDPLPHEDQFYQPLPIVLPADGMGIWGDTMSVYVKYHDPKGGDSTYYELNTGRFIYVADASSGIQIIDISRTHPFYYPDSVVEQISNPRAIGSGDSPSVALSVQTKGRYAYIADDRGGLDVFQLPDTISAFDDPAPSLASALLIANLATTGRTKDLHIVGDYCFLAEANGGLKVVNIQNPGAPTVMAIYTTPYAYGVWADESYIYVTDRDDGLLIFENHLF